MRVILAMLVTAGLAFLGFQLLEETTEYHGGDGKAAQTTVTFDVKIKRYHSVDVAANALWSTCTGNIGWSTSSPHSGSPTASTWPRCARRSPPTRSAGWRAA